MSVETVGLAESETLDGVVERTVTRTAGSNIPELMAKQAYTDDYGAILEQIKNGYDADATRVIVKYNEREGILTITDNGTGMTIEEVEKHYLGMGDSIKKAAREEGQTTGRFSREFLGDRGIAAILLNKLGIEYTLTTWKDGMKTTLNEEFLDDELTLDKELRLRSEPSEDPEKHGTEIKVEGVHFGGESGFDIETLKKKIQWGLPVHLPDFDIQVNGSSIKPKVIEKSQEFIFDETGEHMGRVHGSLHLANQGTEFSGLHVYVHGTRYDDPQTLVPPEAKVLASRLVGILYADDLVDATSMDRGRFERHHKGFQELMGYVGKAVLEMRRWKDESSRASRQETREKEKPRLLEKVGQRVRGAKIPGVPPKVKLRWSDNDLEGRMGVYNPRTKTVSLNPNHPILYAAGKPQEHEAAMLTAAVDVLARARLEEHNSVTLDDLERETADIWTRLRAHPKSADEPVKRTVFESVPYGVHELSAITDLQVPSLRYLVSTGMLEEHAEDVVLGGSYIEIAGATKGMLPLPEFIPVGTKNRPQKMDHALSSIEIAGELAYPFVRDLNPGEGTTYWIDGTFFSEIAKFLISGIKGLKSRRIAEAYEGFRDRFHTMPIMAETLGISPAQLGAIMRYAGDQEIEIRTNAGQRGRHSGSGLYLADVLDVMQHSRGIPSERISN